MSSTDQIVLSIVEESLGKPRRTREDNPQKYFNCKSDKCRHDIDKYNLAFHAESKIFKCWKCQVKGSVYTLIKQFGSKEHLEKLKLALPYFNSVNGFNQKNNVDYDSVTCELPKEYLPLWEYRDSFKYRNALSYVLNDRRISMEQIKEWKIGYTEEGKKKLRIIIPSYNRFGQINYYEARAYWDKLKETYMKPEYPDKDDIIFGERDINYDLPVYLVEGVFDHKRIPNSIPMLGKKPSDLLIMRLLQNNARIVLCLDEDAIKDCYDIFNLFSSLGLDVYYIDMTGHDDVSRTYELKGNDGIIEILSKATKLTFNTYLQKTLKYKNNE